LSNRSPNERKGAVGTASLQNGVFGARARRDEMCLVANGRLSPGGADQRSSDDPAMGATCAVTSPSQGVTHLSLNDVARSSGYPIEADDLSPKRAEVMVSSLVRIATISSHRCTGAGVPLRSPHSRRGTGPPQALIGR
jgi:hypothetical protein